MDNAAIAERLWPSTAKAESSAPEPVAAEPANDLASRLYPEPKPIVAIAGIPETVKASRAADPLRKLYSPQTTFGREVSADDFRAPGVTPEQQAAAATEFREMLGDLGLDLTDARTLVQIIKQNRETIDDKTQALWKKEASERLVEMNGGNIDAANRDLARAQKLVQSDPRWSGVFNRVGNHPAIVRTVVLTARRLAIKGTP